MKTLEKYCPVLTVLGLIGVWWIISALQNNSIIFPTPIETAGEMLKVFSDGGFYLSVLSSLLRTVVSFSIAFVLAVAFAVFARLSTVVERLFYPIVVLVRATPTMSVIFLCLIWFSSKISPMLVAIAVIFPTMYSSVLTAIKSCDEKLLEMSKIYKVPTRVTVFKLYLPFVSDKIFSDAVSALSLNVKLIVAAEALAQTAQSLGVLMQISKANLDTATLFAYTVTAIVMSCLLELFLKLVRFIIRRIKNGKIK